MAIIIGETNGTGGWEKSNYAIYNGNGEIILNNVVVTADNPTSNYETYNYGIYNGWKMTLTNIEIILNNECNWGKNNGIYVNGGIVTIENAKISTFSRNSSNYGIYNNLGSIEIKEVNITNTSSKTSYGIYNSSDGTITLNDGTIMNNSYGIYNESTGSININGGIIANNTYGIHNANSGNIIIGDKTEQTNKNKPIIEQCQQIGLYNNQGYVEFNNGSIHGKTALSGNISKTRENYRIVKNNNNGIEILQLEEKLTKEYIVQIDKTKYYTLNEAIESLGEEEKVIQVLKDFELDETILFNKNIILDLNGYTITNNFYKVENIGNLLVMDSTENKEGKIESQSIYNAENGNIVIESGNVNTKTYGIYNKDNGIITMNGGTINSKSYGIYNISVENITMNGGTINSKSYGIYNISVENITINGGTINSESYGIYSGDNGNIIINGGEINCDVSSGVGIRNGNNGNISIEGGTIKGNSKGINQDSGTINISNGKIISNNYGIYGYNITVNINGGEIITNSTNKICYGIYSDITSNHTSNIIMKSGSIKSISTNNTAYGIMNKGGNVIVTGGIVESSSNHDSYGIYTSSYYGVYGSISIGIKGDEIISQEKPYIKGEYIGTSSNYVGYGIYNTTGELYLYDGKIEGSTKAVYEIITEIEENTYLNYNEDETILTLSSEEVPIAQIGEITYTDLQEAIEATTEKNRTIKILRNIVYTIDNAIIIIPNTKNVILDLNGHKITSSIPEKTIQNEGNLEIIDTSNEKTGKIISNVNNMVYNANNAKLIIDGGNIENRGVSTIYNEGELIINGGIIDNNESYKYGIYNIWGDVKVNGGTINSDYAIYNVELGSIEIADGIINGDNYGIYNLDDGKIEITGGTVSSSGSCSIYNNSDGEIIVKKGTINTTNNSSYGSSYGIYNKEMGSIIIGIKEDGIVSHEEPIVKGNKTSTSSSYVGYGIYNPKGTLYYYDGKIQGTDKTINGNITEIENLTEINLSEEIVNNKVYKNMTLTQITTNIASIKGTEYDSIQKAIEACGEVENTIELLRDSNLGATIIIGENQNITIDLKGHTINNYTELQNKGKLKIIDSSPEQTGKIVGLTGTAISNTGIIEIQGGVILDSGYGIKNTGTITLNGGKITGNTYGIYNDSNGIINIEQGNISSNTYGIYNYSSSSITNINEGTITSNEYGIYNYNGTTNITTKGITSNTYGLYAAGGTVTVKEGAEIQSETGIYVSSGTLNIGETGTMNPDSPIIIGETYGLSVTATGKVYMYDGQVKGKTGATEGYITYTEEGYVVANKTEGEYFVDYLALGGTANAVAQVNGVSYSNLQSAINSITGGEEQTIILLNGIVSTETYTITEGQNIKLDMNGKTITSEAEETINNSGNLTIIDTSGKNVAKITSTTGTAIVNIGTLTLGEDEGTVTEGLITIEGSTYGIENTGELNFYDGAVIGTTAINGEVKGTPSGYTITISTVSGKQKATLIQ